MPETGVLIVGAGSAGRGIARTLEDSGRHGHVVLDLSGLPEPVSCDFDEATDRWRVRTESGEVHRPRILVAGPGTTAPIAGRGGASLEDALRGEQAAYLGIAHTGFPNLFLVTGTHAADEGGHIRTCLTMMTAEEATRIEVRAGAQREFNRILHRTPARSLWRPRPAAARGPQRSAFELSNIDEREEDNAYAGSAALTTDEVTLSVRVHLSGHFEPLDGNYHWYGRIAGDKLTELKQRGRSAMHLTIPGGPETPATLAEQDPWGNYRITGVGAPPFPLEPVEIVEVRPQQGTGGTLCSKRNTFSGS
ncbi:MULTISPECIES: DUF4873 domain-containing protein [Rhodococcus]|uniref:DUF4873 domain-containing protein n=1 Tax=Rhodococcus TaxID=1827 RepID=UPI001AEA8055|nr:MULTISPECIES: DUF4873 domain-containing protein [Rhodococcus]MBP1160390.1 hypothetical protein [Rhodococcus sp. PvR099]MCZ4556128.1 DUF4873 domain-containing protein [Rhodococcus maanshanensis]